MVPKPKLVLYTFWLIAALSIFVLNCFGAFYITFVSDTIILVEVGIFWRSVVSLLGLIASLGFLITIVITIHGLIKSYIDEYMGFQTV